MLALLSRVDSSAVVPVLGAFLAKLRFGSSGHWRLAALRYDVGGRLLVANSRKQAARRFLQLIIVSFERAIPVIRVHGAAGSLQPIQILALIDDVLIRSFSHRHLRLVDFLAH